MTIKYAKPRLARYDAKRVDTWVVNTIDGTRLIVAVRAGVVKVGK